MAKRRARRRSTRRRDLEATPSARALADRLGVDLAKIKGTGKAGRIVLADVRKAAPGKRTGRPPKLLEQLPDGRTRGEAIVDAVRGGAYVEHAAAYGGVSESAMFDWRARGREWIGAEPKEIPEGMAVYVEFAESLEKARADAIVASVGRIRQAGQGTADRAPDWKADAWWLERTMPDRFGRRLALREEEGGGKAPPIDEDRVRAHDDALAAAYEDEIPDMGPDLEMPPPARGPSEE